MSQTWLPITVTWDISKIQIPRYHPESAFRGVRAQECVLFTLGGDPNAAGAQAADLEDKRQ